MKIVVTGGAGFLGSHLCRKLVGQHHQVICLDNLLTGNLQNIEDLKHQPNFTFHKHDVSSGLQGLTLEPVDYIYHLASPASPSTHSYKSYHHLPFETMLVNTQGTWKLAQEAVSMGAKFLFASTSEVYGEPLEHPQKEDYRGNVSTIGPRSAYDEAKRFGETITSTFVRSKGLDARIIRIFNTYGPNMALDDGRAVTEFIKAALTNTPFPVEGDGSSTRSFCFVDDLIGGIIKAMEIEDTCGQVFNLGNDQEFTILELAKKIKELTSSPPEIKFLPIPEDSPTRRRPDISKAREVLGWEPKVSLEEGLKATIEYSRHQIQ